jgi:hypothetical protein
MPLQNRVTPFGDIIALPGRGTLIGNRGILHDEHRTIVRTAQVRRWIACALSFRGRHRKIMQPHTWTELFFLDEATALAAGHRPCAECRNQDYKRFSATWQRAFGERGMADIMDARMQRDRRDRGAKRTYSTDIGSLPDGTYIAIEGAAWLVWGDGLHRWSDGGYTERRTRPAQGEAEVLTPRSIVDVIAAGYIPAVHPSLYDRDERT